MKENMGNDNALLNRLRFMAGQAPKGNIQLPCSEVLQLITLAQRATEAKPSASAAPGIKTWEERMPAIAAQRPENLNYNGDQIDARDAEIADLRAAIAAAREEERQQQLVRIQNLTHERDIARRAADDLSVYVAVRNATIADLRARLAAPEGEAVAKVVAITPMMGIATVMLAPAAFIEIGASLYAAAPQAKAPQQPPAGEREAFEKWMREEWECTDDDLKRVNDGAYFWDSTATSWHVWRGARHLGPATE